jgi:hypothetical protein
MEAKYNTPSMAMRDVLPLYILTIKQRCGYGRENTTTIKTTVWEDNTGALRLAKMEPVRTTPRSNAYGVKYHWFRSKLKSHGIEVKKIAGTDHRADFLMKALIIAAFVANRKLTCGW